MPCRNTRSGCTSQPAAVRTTVGNSDAANTFANLVLRMSGINQPGELPLLFTRRALGFEAAEATTPVQRPANVSFLALPPVPQQATVARCNSSLSISDGSTGTPVPVKPAEVDDALVTHEALVSSKTPADHSPQARLSASQLVLAMQSHLRGPKRHSPPKTKKVATRGKGLILKRPAAATDKKWGCSKCRNSRRGCGTCGNRDPAL